MKISIIVVIITILIIIVSKIFPYILERIIYKNSNYKVASGNSFHKTFFHKGNRGEFLTYRELEKLGGYNKILANAYIPKKDGTTSEVDLILIHQNGIYVIESKNYSGCIFGDEKNKNWLQTFENGYKQPFYNPIWQNNTHIRHLNNFLDDLDRAYFKSVIVFSERCNIKEMNVRSEDVRVVKRENLYNILENMFDTSKMNLSIKEIDDIYNRLTPFILKTDREKKKHISDIKKRK